MRASRAGRFPLQHGAAAAFDAHAIADPFRSNVALVVRCGLLDSDEVALSAPVRIEILAGASNRDDARLRRVLSALPLFFPTATIAIENAFDRCIETSAMPVITLANLRTIRLGLRYAR